jgi:serine/threonine protein kinase
MKPASMAREPEGSAPHSVPERVGGKYRVIRKIASGGMGTVYEVEHDTTGERLALKIVKGTFDDLDATALERFRREARVHAMLKNEHLVRVIDADVASELGGAPYLVMDLLEGETLADAVGEEPQSPERVVAWLRQLARVMDLAHEAGVIHRDLKPENLFLTCASDGSELIKILDFGVAKFRSGTDRSRTSTGALVGTPLYMAPEQAAGEQDRIGPGTDVWSIGMIAFRLLAGFEYWTTGNVAMLLAEIVSQPVKAPSRKGLDMGDELDAWFEKSCAREPTERFASVGEQVEALAEALGVPPLSQEAPEPRFDRTLPSPHRPRAGAPATSQSLAGSVASARRQAPARGRAALWIGAVLAAAVGVGVLVGGSQSSEAPTATGSVPSAAPSPAVPPETASEPGPAPSQSPPADAAPVATDAAVPQPTKTAISRPPPVSRPTRVVSPAPPPSARDPLADPK